MGLVVFLVAGLVLTLFAQDLWGALLTANLRTGIALPWSAPAIGLIFWAAWWYLGGAGPPASSAPARRRYRRANQVSAGVFAWALLANALAITALAGGWIVIFQLVKAPGNALPDFSRYPWAAVAVLLATAALAGALSEEVGIRGYLQGRLERRLPAPAAIVIAALIVSPGHGLTQGFVWSTLLFYFAVDVVYGVTACLTDSILPGVVAHTAGLLVFFTLIWPHDASRRLVSAGGADAGFWLHLAMGLIFGAGSVWCFARLARMTAASRARRTEAPGALAAVRGRTSGLAAP